eukprot:c2442_g1_i1.p1 GENE.c2442_g1_i1~~c2442_g1_i1.p1  ORF type:complete len:138 (-),score=38.65 c2442_g1_i1:13-381(-)
MRHNEVRPYGFKVVDSEMKQTILNRVTELLSKFYEEAALISMKTKQPINYQEIGAKIKTELDMGNPNPCWNIVFGHRFAFHVDHEEFGYLYIKLLSYDIKDLKKHPEGKTIIYALIYKSITE